MKRIPVVYLAIFSLAVFSLPRMMRELPRYGNANNLPKTFLLEETAEDTMDSREFKIYNQTLDHELYRSVYDAYHRGVGLRGSVNQNNMGLNTRNETIKLDLSTYGDDIMNKGCELTVLIMDPRISSYRSGAPVYFALESVAAYLPNACVLIQTSNCRLHKTSTNTNNEDGSDEPIYKNVYESSLPLFQGMIERGQVRIKFLDHKKYGLRSCNHFFDPSLADMNYHYWGDDEFIPKVDSDNVLLIQTDSVLCHSFDIDMYKHYDYVGGVWQRNHPYIRGMEMCQELPKTWKSFHRHLENNTFHFPKMCEQNDIAPLGNGGFSLRRRSGMKYAIESCPHDTWSGLDKNAINNATCRPGAGPLPEDVYFGTVLRGLPNGSIPSAFKTSLFSVEMIWAEQSIELYGGPALEDRYKAAEEVSGTYNGVNISSIPLERRGLCFNDFDDSINRLTIPIGMHKPWLYFSNEILLSKDVDDQCPFLKYVFHPRENRAIKK